MACFFGAEWHLLYHGGTGGPRNGVRTVTATIQPKIIINYKVKTNISKVKYNINIVLTNTR